VLSNHLDFIIVGTFEMSSWQNVINFTICGLLIVLLLESKAKLHVFFVNLYVLVMKKYLISLFSCDCCALIFYRII
jgi:hypothetical protein